jgi:hypothetical protein
MKTILDPSFRYTASFNTDLKKTFAKIRRGHRKEVPQAAPSSAATVGNVTSIVRRSAERQS